MNRYLTIIIATIGFFLFGCADGQSQSADGKLNAVEFSKKITQTTNPVVIDVRTPEEFTEGHLPNALNYNWHGGNFEQQISGLDKTKPVFVYCRSGRRSNAAARNMQDQGFQQVYELSGGILKWRKAGLPEIKGN
jgi:rhodanese-related sulfurtransferase